MKAVGIFLFKQRWPPFLATELFLPRFRVLVANHESSLGETWVELQASRIPDDAIHPAQTEGPWVTIARRTDNHPWKQGETRTYRFKAKTDAFPREGLYALRIKMIEVGPVSFTENVESRGVRIEHRFTTTVNTTLVMHQFRVHPPGAAIAFLGFAVATVGTAVSLLAVLISA